MVKPKPTKNKTLDLPAVGGGTMTQTQDPGDGTLAAHTSAILAAIKDTKQNLETQIAAAINEVSILRTNHRKLAERTRHIEIKLKMIHPNVQDLEKRCAQLEIRVSILTDHLQDAEGRSRRYNIQLVWVPEKVGAECGTVCGERAGNKC
ncbi:hypothetical protein NDU88_002185 [Pleurodeles waltl]|uniref:Uncharacterized protein n=1 Tax=Pleurodeles waltl TaxID=8319 RepID=A0AAV7U8J5_PLEWA|nr:hypothetical protein NDU88_002185 [Pleurodeles waltl]